MDRKKMNKSELFKECDRRGVGYMSNWTKPMLISRLKEEDEKDEVVHKPIEIWNEMHINLNNLKGQLKMSEDSMSEVISRKKKLHEHMQGLKEQIRELESSIKVLVDTGMFSYEEHDGMIYTEMFPEKN